jgi:catechol 2,3-dioxygenase-like lactoylglutathione lyase family enzyme
MTKLGLVILYTPDVAKKIAFYEKAFGVERKFVSDEGAYGELAGDVPLGFVAEEFARKSAGDFVPLRTGAKPNGFEIGFIFDDLRPAFDRAVKAGCTPVLEPTEKPWGQTVAYVRDDDGVLVELCTPWST